MPELTDNDLRKLFRTAGRPELGADLSDRIMARVSVTLILQPLQVKPLISRSVWFAIGAIVFGLVAVIASLFTFDPSSPSLLGSLWQNLPDLTRMQLPTGKWILWAAMATGCFFLIALTDRALEKTVK